MNAMRRQQNAAGNLAMGACSGTVAATACYPLDTIRRRMQMAGPMYAGQVDAFRQIWQQVPALNPRSVCLLWHSAVVCPAWGQEGTLQC